MMKKNKKIIAFAGRQRSGKTHLANLLKDEDDALVLTIAKYLKTLCCNILDIDNIDELNRLKNDRIILNITPNKQWVDKIATVTGINYDDIVKELNKYEFIKDIRSLLQVIGTNIIRKYNPNWHVEQLRNEINASKNSLIAIDDVRFPNELNLINQLGGKIFFVIRTTGISDTMISNHESETALKWYDFTDDRIILNTETTDFLNDRFIRSYRDNFKDTDTNEIYVSANKSLLNNPLVIEDLKNRI